MPDERVGGERGRCGERRGIQEGWIVVGGDACLGVRCVVGKRLWIVSKGSVRIAARRQMGTESGVVDPVSVVMDLHDLRMKEDEVARRRTCGHVVILFFQKGVRRGRREACIFRAENSQYACLYV